MYARAFLTLTIEAASNGGQIQFNASGLTPAGEPFAIALIVPDSIASGLADLVSKSPKCLVEGDLTANEDTYILAIRNVSPAADDTYCNSVVGVAGVGPASDPSSSGKTHTRGLAIGDGDHASWLNLRVSTSSALYPAFKDAAPGSRCLFAGTLQQSEPLSDKPSAGPYRYIQCARFQLIASTGAPVAPAGTTKLSAAEDLP